MSHSPAFRPQYNEFGEELEIYSDLVLNLEYWDCTCEIEYIHPVSLPQCWRCEATFEERPNAREPEVRAFRERTNFQDQLSWLSGSGR